MAEVVERAVDARLLALPLRVWLRGKVEGYLPGCLREGDGQVASRVVVAEEHVGDCGAALRAGEPSFDDGGHVLVHPVDTQGPSVDEDDDYGLARGVDCLDKFELPTGQIETRSTRTLA